MTLPITAIIVAYHSDAVLSQCIASLAGVQEIIVANNGGTTQSNNAIFLNNRKNLGFGRAINRALVKVKTPYVLLINPDALLQPGAVGGPPKWRGRALPCGGQLPGSCGVRSPPALGAFD